MRHTLMLAGVLALLVAPLSAAQLDPRTIAAFDRYVRLTAERMAEELRVGKVFLRLDSLPADERRARLERLKRGEVVIDRLQTREGSTSIEVPNGIIHHWIGVAFVPGATVDRAVGLLQDYDHHAEIFRPAVTASKVLARDGDRFRVYLRFFMKKIVAVTLNTENEARFVRPAADRAYSQVISTRIAEVEHAGTPRELEKPVGNDSGYMWRLNTYWRFLERDGGAFIQCESINLSRDIPLGLGWIVGPFVTSIPRESLTFTMERARTQLLSK
jgi:hypothetical protein